MDVHGSLAPVLGLGFLLGLRHATDADHLAAVCTLASRHRSVVRSALLGSFWGFGHTLALLAGAAVTMALRLTISPAVAETLERLVGVMLVGLGGQVVVQALRGVHVHPHDHAHDHLLRLGTRPFLVGLMHGLAGSAGLTLLVVSSVSSPWSGVLYIVVFGAGSTAGMLVLSGLIGLPFVLTARHSDALHLGLRLAAGAASLGLGVWLLSDLL